MTRSWPNRRVALLVPVVAAIAVVAAACSGGGGPAPSPPAPADPEAGAAWATSLLDPCALLSPDVVDNVDSVGDPFVTSPHSCALTLEPGTGASSSSSSATPAAAPRTTTAPGPSTDDRIVVRIGTAFGTTNRAAAYPVAFGDRHAYVTRDVGAGARVDPRCVVDVPMTSTRSVQIDAPVQAGDDLRSACSAAQAVGDPIAKKLGSPGDYARAALAGDLGRWNACDLLEKSLGWTADRSAFSSPDADQCRATPKPESGAAQAVSLRMAAGPAAIGPPARGETVVSLPSGDAVQVATAGQCTLTFVGQTIDPAPVDAAAERLTLVERTDDGDPCTAAVASATSIMTTAANAPDELPQAPDHLGFAPDKPDDAVPVACGVPDAAPPGVCQAPQPVDVPPNAGAVLSSTTAAAGPRAADASCAILRAVAPPVTGDLELAAAEGTGCVGLSMDGYAVTLGFTDLPAQGYCAGASARREDVPVDGRPGVRCTPSDDTFDLTVPALGAATATKGVLHVSGRLLPARGDRTRTRPADAARVHDLTVGIATAVVGRYLSSS